MRSSFPSHSDPDHLVHTLAGACHAVHRRLGPSPSRDLVLDALISELAERGIQALKNRNTPWSDVRRIRRPRFAVEDFDLVIEGRVGLDLVATHTERELYPSLGSFEDRLRRHGLAAGLVADFEQADLCEGLWIGRVRGAVSPEWRFSAGVN